MPSDKPKLLVIVDEDLLVRLENYRRRCKQIPSKSEAVRTLLDESLKKHEKKKK